MAGHNFFLVHLILCFCLKETRNSSNIFIQLSDSYPGLSNWCKFSEQLTSTELLLPTELYKKPAQVVQAATKKIGKKNRKQSTIHGLNVEP